MADLDLPVPGSTPGPLWATKVNTALGAVNSDIQALPVTYPVYRLWTGTSYPARIAGAVNVFMGPSDPGLLMASTDVWTNPGSATLADVVSAMSNTGSALYAATTSVVDRRDLQLTVVPAGVTVPFTPTGTSPAIVNGYTLPKGGTNGVRLMGHIPQGWSTAALRYKWMSLAGSGDARLNTSYSLARVGTASAFSFTTTTQFTTSAPTTPVQVTLPSAFPVTPGDHFSGAVNRISDNALDTISGGVLFMDAWLERLS